jgi:hypothetical protein
MCFQEHARNTTAKTGMAFQSASGAQPKCAQRYNSRMPFFVTLSAIAVTLMFRERV